MSVFDALVKHGLPIIPKFIVGRVAQRYVAGSSLDDAVRTIRDLNSEGCMATVDVLGEEVTERPKAEAAVTEYLRLLEVIDEQGLDTNISIKPTLLGLKIDRSLCQSHVATIAQRAKQLGNFVRIDMEDSSCTDDTLSVYREVQAAHGNVGAVLQAYMRRTVADIARLLPLRPNIRICKGIYREPRQLAWHAFETVRSNFIYSMEKLMAGGAYVAIATHDPHLVWAGERAIDRLGLAPDQYEFQMLLGVDTELRRIILDAGHRLRVYVPYGRDWYPYSIRRLRENPTVARHVTRAMLGFGPR
jgi:proline dehydrogenase